MKSFFVAIPTEAHLMSCAEASWEYKKGGNDVSRRSHPQITTCVMFQFMGFTSSSLLH